MANYLPVSAISYPISTNFVILFFFMIVHGIDSCLENVMTINELTHEELVLAEALENPDGFAAIYKQYFPQIYTYIRYRVNDDATADELTAYVFERAMTRLNQYDAQRGAFVAWLFGIARQKVLNHNRRQRRWQMLPLEWLKDKAGRDPQPETWTEKQLQEERLLKAVSQLDEREQDIIALKFASGMTNRRIAEVTGLSESNIGVIVYRTLKQLRQQLEEGQHV